MAEDGEKVAIEQQLERAVCARLQHFKDQADSLTLESVRRLLEKDLGLEKFALDTHKRFIRHFLEKKMDSADDCNSKAATENVEQDAHLSKEEANMLHKQLETKADPKKASTGDEEIMEDSPIMGVLTPKSEVGTQGSSLSESRIEEAIWARAGYFQANSEKLTLAGVRRLLEEDLGLDKNTLDPFKKFISHKIDKVLSSPEGTKSVKDANNKASENIKSKKSKKDSSEDESATSHSEGDEMEDKVKLRKQAASKRNIKKLEQPKKRKISEKTDLDVSVKKQNKLAKRQKQEDNYSDEDGSVSEDGRSQSSIEKPALKEKTALGYGKQVENLKSIIKACGMSVAPSIYKKAKQVADDKREAFIVKELEGILSREGLSKNPTEKEIKDCRKRKETARELEGIDMSNIISSSRRRSTFSFVAPEKPGILAKKDKVDAKASKKKDKNVKNHNDANEDVEKDKEEKEKDDDNEEDKKDNEEEDKKDNEEEEEKDDEEEVEDEDEDAEEEEDDDEEEDEDESEDFNEDDSD